MSGPTSCDSRDDFVDDLRRVSWGGKTGHVTPALETKGGGGFLVEEADKSFERRGWRAACSREGFCTIKGGARDMWGTGGGAGGC